MGTGAIALTLNIWGLLKTKFFGVQILGKLGFVTSSVAAICIIGERLTLPQILALALAVIGVILFAWPKRVAEQRFTWDKGVIYIILSVIMSSFSAVFYKLATHYTTNYTTFLSGRFIADLIGWSAIWIITLLIMKRNPVSDLARALRMKAGMGMVFGVAASSLISSYLIYKLPVTTLALLGTLTIPSAYFFSQYHYRERLTRRMWLGTVCIVLAVVMFLL